MVNAYIFFSCADRGFLCKDKEPFQIAIYWGLLTVGLGFWLCKQFAVHSCSKSFKIDFSLR